MSSLGRYRHLVLFQNPAPPVPDGDGSFTLTWSDVASWPVSLEPATARDLERVTSGTVISTAAYLVTGRYHPSVSTQTRMIEGGRIFAITGVTNVHERGDKMELIAVLKV